MCSFSSNDVIRNPLITKKIETPKSPFPMTFQINQFHCLVGIECPTKTKPIDRARRPSSEGIRRMYVLWQRGLYLMRKLPRGVFGWQFAQVADYHDKVRILAWRVRFVLLTNIENQHSAVYIGKSNSGTSSAWVASPYTAIRCLSLQCSNRCVDLATPSRSRKRGRQRRRPKRPRQVR